MPQVLQSIEPWLATADLKLGAPIRASIEENLKNASAVVLCLTRQNIVSDAFRAEIKILAKTASQVIPICIDFPTSELGGAFLQHDAVSLDAAGMRSLITLLNGLSDDPLNHVKLDRLISLWTPHLATEVDRIFPAFNFKGTSKPKLIVDRPRSRTMEETLNELLGEVQSLSATLSELQVANAAAMASSGNVEPAPPLENPKPRIFIGSSVEGLRIAEHIQAGLDHVAECTVWNQGVFQPSVTAIETLVESAVSFDCAVIVLTADDIITMRETTAPVARDNLIFELGLFTGMLGRAKTFMVKCRDDQIQLPSDLNGVTALDYGNRTDGNLSAALTPVCLRIKGAMGIG